MARTMCRYDEDGSLTQPVMRDTLSDLLESRSCWLSRSLSASLATASLMLTKVLDANVIPWTVRMISQALLIYQPIGNGWRDTGCFCVLTLC